jgi:hypothetical protein
MKKLTSLSLCALLAPAITLGVSAALAQQPGANPQGAQPQQRETPAVPANPQAQERADAERTQAQQRAGAERAQAQQRSGSESVQSQHATLSGPIVSKPADSMLAQDLIGSALMSRQDQNFGPINDFILSEDGQILAVIVGVGGFLGVGQRDVAIAWDSLERHVDADGDTVFHVDLSDAALRAAPEYKND